MSSSQDPMQPNRVFVGGISWRANEQQLAEFFASFGKVLECKIIMDKVTGKSKGYGFVTFEDVDGANKVKQSTNLYFLGKMMNVGDAVRKSDMNKSQSQQMIGYVPPYGSHMEYNPSYGFYNQPNYYPQQPFLYNPNLYVPIHPAAYGYPAAAFEAQQFPGWQQPAMMAPSGMYQATGNDAQSDPPPLAPSNAVNVTANEHQSPLRSEQENTV